VPGHALLPEFDQQVGGYHVQGCMDIYGAALCALGCKREGRGEERSWKSCWDRHGCCEILADVCGGCQMVVMAQPGGKGGVVTVLAWASLWDTRNLLPGHALLPDFDQQVGCC
jgi:hypothetical protein